MTEYLVDTNALLRRIEPGSPQRPVIRKAMRALVARGDRLCITAQNLHEFWYVATRPTTKNGLGLSPAKAEQKVRVLKGAFHYLSDKPEIYPEWETLITTLITTLGISGALSYDARLVAVMRVYGLTHILTFNVVDFSRFPGIVVVDPASL